MAKRTVKVAVWEYFDEDGVRHLAFFDQEVDLPEGEIERGTAAGVFDPDPVPVAVISPFERALSGIEPHVAEPIVVGDPELPPPPHNVLAPDADATSPAPDPIVEPDPVAAEPVTLVQPQDFDQLASPNAVVERPRKAASIGLWREYVVAATRDSENPISSEQAAEMSKDDLQAAVPAPPED